LLEYSKKFKITKNKKSLLTKSKYLVGLQCPKYLWTMFHEKHKISEPVINLDVDLAPIVMVTGDETVYKGAGHSHFSFVKDKGYHVTTHLPKMGLRENSFSLRDNIEVMDL